MLNPIEMEPIYLQISIFTIICLRYLFLAVTERYCSSDIREEESFKLSKHYMMIGGFLFIFLLFISSLIFYQELNFTIPDFILKSIPMIFVLFLVGFFGLASRYISSREVREIKKVKLADEIYLARTDELKISDLFLNTYRFNAVMIKKYGKGNTAGFYSVLGLILFIIYIYLLHSFFTIHFLCFYIFIFIIFVVLSLYGYKKNKERMGKAVQLASEWHSE